MDIMMYKHLVWVLPCCTTYDHMQSPKMCISQVINGYSSGALIERRSGNFIRYIPTLCI